MAWPEDKIKRLAKVEQIIAKLEALDPSLIDRYERDDFGNILRDKTPEVPSAAVPSPASYRSFGTSKVSMSEPPGMLNTGGGMISSAGLSPTALAQWEPEAVEARQQQRMA